MAGTVEDVLNTLGEMKNENAKNNDIFKNNIDTLVKSINEKQNITVDIFNNLQTKFKELEQHNEALSTTKELKDLFNVFQEHAEEILSGINAQKTILENVSSVVSDISSDKSDKIEIIEELNKINSEINSAKSTIEQADKGTTKLMNTLSESIETLATREDFSNIKSQIDILLKNSADTISGLRFFNEKNKELADAIQNLINSDEYTRAWQKIDTISNQATEITSRMSYMPLKSDTDELSEKIEKVKSDINSTIIANSAEKFEKINSMLFEMSNNLIEKQKSILSEIQSGSSKDIILSLTEDVKELADIFNTNAQNYKILIYDAIENLKDEMTSKKDELSDNILNIQNFIPDVNQKLVNLEAINNEFKTSIESIFAGLNTVNQNITSIDCTDKTEVVKNGIFSLQESINGILKSLSDFIPRCNGLEHVMNSLLSKDDFDITAKKTDLLCAKGEELIYKISQLPVREEIDGLFDDVTQKIVRLSGDFITHHDEFANKFEELKSTLSDYFDELKNIENLTQNNTSELLSERFTEMGNIVTSAISRQDEKFDTLNHDISGLVKESKDDFKTNLTELTKSIEDKLNLQKNKIETLSKDVQSEFENIKSARDEDNEKLSKSINELLDIREGLSQLSEILTSANTNTETKLDEGINLIDEDIKGLINSIDDIKNNFENNSNFNSLQGSIDSINYRFDELFENLKQINENVEHPEFMNDITEKISTFKDELELVKTDVTEIINTGYERIMSNVSELKSDISDFTNYDFDKSFANLKTQIELSYLNVGSDIKDFANQNRESLDKIEQLYSELRSQISSLENDLKHQMPEGLELIKVTIDALTRSIEVKSQKREEFEEKCGQELDEIKSLAMTIRASLVQKLGGIATELKTRFINSTSEIKDHITNSNGTERTIAVIESVKNDLEHGINNILLSQADKSEETKVIQDSISQLGTTLKDFVTSACENSFDRINSTLSEVKTLGTMVDGDGQITSVIENIKTVLSDEINAKLNEHILKQQKQLHKIKQDINSFIYTETIEEEKNRILDELYAFKVSSKGDKETEKFISQVEKRISQISAKNPSNSYIKALTDNSQKNILQELIKIKEEISLLLVESQDSLNNLTDSIEEVLEYNTDITESLQDLKLQSRVAGSKTEAISGAIDSIESKIDVLDSNDIALSQTLDTINTKVGMIDELITSDDKIEQTLNILHTKVDILAQNDNDNFDIAYELEDLKNVISDRISELQGSKFDERSKHLDDCLNELLTYINNIDKNSKDVKDSVISAIVSVFDQVSFVEETEEIKDFVEEKTGEINDRLKEVRDQLQLIATGEVSEYTYTLQDVESDIAKLRLAMNEISSSSSTQAIEDLSASIDKIVDSVESMKSGLSQDEIFDLKNDFARLSEDMMSISSRTNKLILSSDESYKALSDGLDRFGSLIYQLEDKFKFPDTTEISERIEKKIDDMHVTLNNSVSNDRIFHQVLQYLGEWMDSVSESINSITEKTSEIIDVKGALDELKESVPEKSELIEEIGHKFEAQELRIDRLEMKLDNILMAMEEHSESIVSKKLDKLEKELAKLTLSIEKITSYVDEE